MSNAPLTVDMITRESLRILHQKMTFISSINRQYDNAFANEGAKIGSSLRIRLPNQYTVTTGPALDAQDTTEQKVTLTVSTQKHVGMNFTDQELTMDLDDFSTRIIEPAMAALAANVEADALQNMTLDVYNIIDNDGSALTYKNITDAGAKLKDNLSPTDNRHVLLSNSHESTVVDALKGLFQASGSIASQYREGVMGRSAGFNFAASSHVSNHTTGTSTKGDSGRNINGANQTGSDITIDTTGGLTFLAGDIVTLAGVNSVHPETKVDTGNLQQFVVTADCGASSTTLSISPAIVTSGATQNVSASPTTTGAVTKVAAGAGETINGSLAYHRDAFTFATADLQMPTGVDFASRQNYDGLSLRIVRDYAINADKFPCRVDILYGYLTTRPQLACRIHADG